MQLIFEVTEQQADVLRNALDLWTRLATGDLAAILNHPEVSRRLTTDQGLTTEHVRRLMTNLTQAVFDLKPDTYLGLRSPQVLESSRIALDLLQVLTHYLHHDGEPSIQTSAQPLAIMHNRSK